MELRTKVFQIRGMAQDLSSPNIPSDTAFENLNLRFISNESNVSGSITNEKGTLEKRLKLKNDTVSHIRGIPIGTAVFEEEMVIFTTEDSGTSVDINTESFDINIAFQDTPVDIPYSSSQDYIYKLEKDVTGGISGEILYKGELGFDVTYPIQTQIAVENQKLKKIYWTDGLNLPRMINIEEDTYGGPSWQYDFIPDLTLKEKVNITKLDTGGYYYSGTVQYFFTYYNKYKQESNIFHQSPIYYCTEANKGAAPDTQTTNAFQIKITECQRDFDFLRIYVVYRPTVNAPEVRKVADIPIQKTTSSSLKHTVTYVDTGENYEALAVDSLLYVGGQRFTAKTIAANNLRLFLGNLKTPNFIFTKGVKEALKKAAKLTCIYDVDDTPVKVFDFSLDSSEFLLNKNSYEVTTFKVGQTYRFGIQFQDYKGVWSEVIYLGDLLIDSDIQKIPHSNKHKVPVPSITFNSAGQRLLHNFKLNGYIKARPVVVFPEEYERQVICQGLIQPALMRFNDIKNNIQNAFPSWYVRSYDGDIPFSRFAYLNYWQKDYWSTEWTPYIGTSGADWRKPVAMGYSPKNRVNSSRRNLSFEIQNYTSTDYFTIFSSTEAESIKKKRWDHIQISPRTVTIHTPEVYSSTFNISDHQCNLFFIGKTKTCKTYSSLLLHGNTTHLCHNEIIEMANRPDENENNIFLSDWGFDRRDLTVFNYYKPVGNTFTTYEGESNNKIISIAAWEDAVVTVGEELDDENKMYDPPTNIGLWKVFPFHNTQYLTNISFVEKEIKINKGLDFKAGQLEKKIFSYNQFCQDYTIYTNKSGAYGGVAESINPDRAAAVLTADSFGYKDPWNDSDNPDVIECREGKYVFSNSPNIIYNNNVAFFLGQNLVNLGVVGVGNNNNNTIAHQALPLNANKILTLGDNQLFYYASPFIIKRNPNHIPFSNLYQGQWDVAFPEQPITTHVSFKSGPYVVFVTNKGDNGLPLIYRNWALNATEVFKEEIHSNLGGLQKGDMEIGELRRSEIIDIFGGDSEEALERNTWLPCGEAVHINNALTLLCLEGDTYFQKYECLKTFPDESNSQNGIVDVVSFPCETYINVEGRYDDNKYLINPVYVDDTVFNKINPAYTQKNNFFSASYFSTNKISFSHFPNQITWSNNKLNNELIDTWTHFPLLNVLDLRLDKGDLNKLITYNTYLYGFHTSAVVKINYNTQQQIATNQGLPIEIASSENVTGYQTLFDTMGIMDAHHIIDTAGGIVFLDSTTKQLYCLGQELANLTKSAGMNSWFQHLALKSWDPLTFAGTVIQYDAINREILIITKTQCLVYSFDTKTFTSFYSYENTPYVINFKDKNYMLHKTATHYTLWEKHGTQINSFFGITKPYYTTVVLNEYPLSHKILNNIEYQADFYNINDATNLTTTFNFNKLKVWNEYQEGETDLKFTRDNISSLQGKFRTWRVQAPRANKTPHPKDRIAGNWAFVKLGRDVVRNQAMRDPITDHKMILHTITVSYFS